MDREVNSVIYWNCAGGIKSKLDYIKQSFLPSNPDIIFISEAELSFNDLNIVRLKGYELEVAKSINHGKARMACYIKSSINYKIIKIADETLDIIAIETKQDRLVGVYKGFKLPTGKDRVSFFDSIVATLVSVSKTNKLLTVGGDFNVDLLTPSANLAELERWSINRGLTQLVDKVTRERVVQLTAQTVRVEQSAIDHVYTNTDLKLTIQSSISDHSSLHLTSTCKPKQRRTKLLIRDWRHYSKDLVNKTINGKMHQISTSSCELSFDDVSLLYQGALDDIAPYRVVKVHSENEFISTKLEAQKKDETDT